MLDRETRSRRARRRRSRLLTSAYFFVYSVLAASLDAAIGVAFYLLGRLIR